MNFIPSTVTAKSMLITPQIAAEMLVRNTKNRNMSKSYVAALARDMAAGKWQENGDSIRFAKGGVLLDGQHRLTAIVQSQTPIRCWIIEGVDPESMRTIDSGKKRTYSDRLSINGVRNHSRYGPTINLMSYLCGQKSKSGAKGNMGHGLTQSELEQVRLAHPDLESSIEQTHKVFPTVENLIGALHYIACYQNRHSDAARFVEVWRNGQSTYPNDAALFSREWVIKDNARMRRTALGGRQMVVVDGFRRFMKHKPMKSTQTANSLLVPNFSSDDLFTGKAQ